MEDLHPAAVLPEAAKCMQVFQGKIESSASYEAWCSPSTVLALNLQLLAELPVRMMMHFCMLIFWKVSDTLSYLEVGQP